MAPLPLSQRLLMGARHQERELEKVNAFYLQKEAEVGSLSYPRSHCAEARG